MQSDYYKKILNEDIKNAVVKFDEKTDPDYYTNQFDFFSEMLIINQKYGELKQFLKKNNEQVAKKNYEL